MGVPQIRETDLIKKIVYKDYDLDILMEQVERKNNKTSSFAKRLITGQAAEHYFEENYKQIDEFQNFEIENTMKQGCGFDFKLFLPDSDFLAVEVKGLNEVRGSLIMTDKEHAVADILKDRYYLFLVKNFKENPLYEFFQNPLYSELVFTKSEINIKTINWNTKV